ncbi:MAG: type II toxin-antitoxin system RelE/ParE family toxin [Bacteroidota bacterium]
MKTEFTRLFLKDLDKISQKSVKSSVLEIIDEVEKLRSLSEITNIKKLKSYHTAYRIRTGDYRIGIIVDNDVVVFTRLVHRKDIYKVFP